MCKLGFVSAEGVRDLTNLCMVSSVKYGDINNDGFGMAFCNGKDKTSEVVKFPNEASVYWLENRKQINADTLIFHCRLKTHGKIDEESTHPFVSEDERYCLVHNGILNNTKTAVDELTKAKHTFKTDVDSEVLLHAFEEWGSDFIKKLKEFEVGGSATILILDRKNEDGACVYAYTNNSSLVLYEDKNIVFGFTNDDILGGKPKSANKNHLYKIRNGAIIEKTDIGGLKEYACSSSYYKDNAYWESWGYYNTDRFHDNRNITVRESKQEEEEEQQLMDGMKEIIISDEGKLLCSNHHSRITNWSGFRKPYCKNCKMFYDEHYDLWRFAAKISKYTKKTKSYTMICNICKEKFESTDRYVTLCPTCYDVDEVMGSTFVVDKGIADSELMQKVDVLDDATILLQENASGIGCVM